MTLLIVPLSRKDLTKALSVLCIFIVVFETLIIYIMIILWLGFQVNFITAAQANL